MQSTGHTSMHDVSRQSRHNRVITQVIGASSQARHPHGGSTELNCAELSAPRGSAVTMLGEDTESDHMGRMGWSIMVGSRSCRWVQASWPLRRAKGGSG